MFTVDLTSQVPAYGVDHPNWGGAACCQMAMNGYPPGAASCYISQQAIWNYIQAYNKEPGYSPSSWDYGWYADPYAVTKALNDLCPPQHHWVDVSASNKEGVLYTLLRYMANYQYASLICYWSHDYWATLVYYMTSADPRQETAPALQWIGYYWPSGSYGPQFKMVDGASWMNALGYWGSSCDGVNNAGESLCGNIWNNKWVGIGEPPEEEGSIQVESITRTGDRLISPADAAAIAERVVAERGREESGFLRRRLAGVDAAEPMLVRELPVTPERKMAGRDVRYYLIPFAQRHEVDLEGRPQARLSVLVNAYTGRCEELCVFSQPVRYLPERDVVHTAARTLRRDPRDLERAAVELVSQPLGPMVSSALPVWQVAAEEVTFFVTQSAEIVATLDYPTLRGR
jgi:hypothetical protein